MLSINQSGLGCEFIISLPSSVTTQILVGLVVVVRDQQYIIPLDIVERCLRPSWEAVSTIMDQGECIRDDEIIYPIVRLGNVYAESKDKVETGNEGILVIVNAKKKALALLVDKILGIKKVVVKQKFPRYIS